MRDLPKRAVAIDDSEVPALGVLLGTHAPALLDTVLGEAKAHLRTAHVEQVRYVPAKSVTVQYKATVEWPGQGVRDETLVASSGINMPDHVPTVDLGDTNIAVWRYPHDPFLPGLSMMADQAKIRGILEQVGASADDVRLRRRAYRPGRRAVVEAVTPKHRLFVKAVRPKRTKALQDKHSALSSRVPTPASFGWQQELGLVVLEGLAGKTLRRSLEASEELPDSNQLIALLDDLAGAGDAFGAISGPVARGPDHAGLLSRVPPDLFDRVSAVTEAFEHLRTGQDGLSHGDFHSSQILVRDATVIGLIDIDTVGRGMRADDFAVLLAHLSTLSLDASSPKSVERYGKHLIGAFDRLIDPSELRLRVAAAVLGFATGPFRVQHKNWRLETERRVSLAERWIASARSS